MIHYMATLGENGDVLFSANNGEDAKIHGVRGTQDGRAVYYFRRAYRTADKVESYVHEYIAGKEESNLIVRAHLDSDFSSGGAVLDNSQVRQYQKLLKPFDALHKKVVEVVEKIIHYPGRLGAFCFKNWNGDVHTAVDGKGEEHVFVNLRLSKASHIAPSLAGKIIEALQSSKLVTSSPPGATNFLIRWEDFAKVATHLLTSGVAPASITDELIAIQQSLGDAMSHTLPFHKVEEAPRKVLKKPEPLAEPAKAPILRAEVEMSLAVTALGFSLAYGGVSVGEIDSILHIAENHEVECYHFKPLRKIDFAFYDGANNERNQADLAGSILEIISESGIPVKEKCLVQVADVARTCRMGAGAPEKPFLEAPQETKEHIFSAQVEDRLIRRSIREGQAVELQGANNTAIGRLTGLEPNIMHLPKGENTNMAGFNVLPDGTIEWQGIELKEIVALASTLPADKIAAQLGLEDIEVEEALQTLKNPPRELAEYLDREKQKQLREENKKNLKVLKDEAARIEGSKEMVAKRLAEADKNDKELMLAIKKEEEALAIKTKRNQKLAKSARAKIKASRRHTKGEIALQGLGAGGIILAILTVIWAYITKKPMPNLVLNKSKSQKPLELPAAKEEDVVAHEGEEIKIEEKVAQKVEA